MLILLWLPRWCTMHLVVPKSTVGVVTTIESNMNTHSDRATVVRVLRTSWRARSWIVSVALLGAALGTVVTVVSKRVYRAEAVVIPVSARQGDRLDALAGGVGQLAALAGINTQGDSSSRLGLATLKGKEFTASFIRDRGLMPVLFPSRWDGQMNRWKGSPPTLLQGVNLFDRGGIRKIIEDRHTGLVTVQIDWTDRIQAVDWLNSMVERVNLNLRNTTIAERRRSIQFLNAEADRTQSVAVKEAIYKLIETEMKDLAFAETQEEYALKFVDRPITPEPRDFIWPRRAFLVCLGAFAGALLGGIVYLGVENVRQARAQPA